MSMTQIQIVLLIPFVILAVGMVRISIKGSCGQRRWKGNL